MIEGITAESVAHAKAQPNIYDEEPEQNAKIKGKRPHKALFHTVAPTHDVLMSS